MLKEFCYKFDVQCCNQHGPTSDLINKLSQNITVINVLSKCIYYMCLLLIQIIWSKVSYSLMNNIWDKWSRTQKSRVLADILVNAFYWKNLKYLRVHFFPIGSCKPSLNFGYFIFQYDWIVSHTILYYWQRMCTIVSGYWQTISCRGIYSFTLLIIIVF